MYARFISLVSKLLNSFLVTNRFTSGIKLASRQRRK
jgi:hypothetical protein